MLESEKLRRAYEAQVSCGDVCQAKEREILAEIAAVEARERLEHLVLVAGCKTRRNEPRS